MATRSFILVHSIIIVRINPMIVSIAIITYMVIVVAVVPAMIRSIVMWHAIIEVVVVGIGDINTEVPSITACVNRAEEIISLHEPAILRIA